MSDHIAPMIDELAHLATAFRATADERSRALSAEYGADDAQYDRGGPVIRDVALDAQAEFAEKAVEVLRAINRRVRVGF